MRGGGGTKTLNDLLEFLQKLPNDTSQLPPLPSNLQKYPFKMQVELCQPLLSKFRCIVSTLHLLSKFRYIVSKVKAFSTTHKISVLPSDLTQTSPHTTSSATTAPGVGRHLECLSSLLFFFFLYHLPGLSSSSLMAE